MATSKKSRNKKSVKSRSFKINKDNAPFMTFEITNQTAYWIILLSVISISFLVILNIQIETIRAVSNF